MRNIPDNNLVYPVNDTVQKGIYMLVEPGTYRIEIADYTD